MKPTADYGLMNVAVFILIDAKTMSGISVALLKKKFSNQIQKH